MNEFLFSDYLGGNELKIKNKKIFVISLLIIAVNTCFASTVFASSILYYYHHFQGDLGPGKDRSHELGWFAKGSTEYIDTYWSPGSATIELGIIDLLVDTNGLSK